MAPSVKSLRFLIDAGDGTLRTLCTVIFSARDASLFVAPVSASGVYRCGVASFAEGETEISLDTTERGASASAEAPHLSLHESGEAHVADGREKVGPVWVPPLSEWEGRHALTVLAPTVSILQTLAGPQRTSQRKPDFTLQSATGGPRSMRILIFLNGREPTFADDCEWNATLARPHLATPLHAGFKFIEEDPIGKDGTVAVFGGWDPGVTLTSASSSFLWVSAS